MLLQRQCGTKDKYLYHIYKQVNIFPFLINNTKSLYDLERKDGI